MQRVVVDRSFTLEQTFYSDGEPAAPAGAPSVAITRLDGSTVATGDVGGSGTGPYTVTVTAAENTLLDTLMVVWTATLGGQANVYRETVEVAGGVVYTLADARGFSGLNATNNDGSYRISTARLLAARTEVERALEQELCFAMVPRYSTLTVDGSGGTVLALVPFPRVIRSASVSGSALMPADLSMTETGYVYSASRWAEGFQNVTVGLEHGMDFPPPRARDVALALTRRALAGSPADDRATSMSTEQETTTFYVPGNGEPFDIPAANRFVMANSLRTGVA